MNNLTDIAFFEFLYIFNRSPIFSCFISFLFFCVQKLLIINSVSVITDYFIKRHLLNDFTVWINNADINQISFTSVNADDIIIIFIFNRLANIIIQKFLTVCLKVDCNRHVKRKLPFGKSFIFNNVILKSAFFFLVIRIFVFYRLIGLMSYFFLVIYTCFTVKHLGFTVELVYYIW